MWEAIVWVFYNVIPWLWLATTVIYLIFVGLMAFTEKDEYNGAFDFVTLSTGGLSMVVNIIGLLIAFILALLVEYIVEFVIVMAPRRKKV